VPGVTSRFAGQVAVVTGASSGLGPLLAHRIVAEGGRVVMAARRLELVQEQAEPLGDAAVAVRADVTSEDDVSRMIESALSAWGQVDIMINNAAIPGQDKYIWEQTLENWNNTIAVDVTAAMLCSREVLRRSMLERRRGVILNFSSTAGWRGMARKTHYSTAKAALRTLTKVVALEAGPYGIRCNCLAPGAMDTGLLRNWLTRLADEEGTSYQEKRDALVSGLPLRTISTAEDVAEMALFLVSDAARTITGQTVNVDAGDVMLG
jgi:NAD(P)-dependent dehydrogenase (short-subunit alcohol dehydrogenase family)